MLRVMARPFLTETQSTSTVNLTQKGKYMVLDIAPLTGAR